MKYWIFGAFLFCGGTAYAGDTLFATYDLSGTVSAVSAPAEQLFSVGQRVSGDIQIFAPLTGCNVQPAGGCEVEEAAGYSLKVGSVTFSGAVAEFPSELPILILRANNGTRLSRWLPRRRCRNVDGNPRKTCRSARTWYALAVGARIAGHFMGAPPGYLIGHA
jgi:hypothetical protein